MNPKKSKLVSKDTAKELNLDPDLVEAVCSFYWDELHKLISELKTPVIRVKKLGFFRVKSWMLKRALEKYTRMLPPLPESFQKHARYKDMEEKIEKVQGMIDFFEKQAIDKKQHKLKRNGLNNQNLEKQG